MHKKEEVYSDFLFQQGDKRENLSQLKILDRLGPIIYLHRQS